MTAFFGRYGSGAVTKYISPEYKLFSARCHRRRDATAQQTESRNAIIQKQQNHDAKTIAKKTAIYMARET
jgi:hypothetical protein